MTNIATRVEGDILHISIDLTAQGKPSSTGKTLLVASSEGNATIEGAPGFKLGLNLFKPRS